jgi:hypothetical protein
MWYQIFLFHIVWMNACIYYSSLINMLLQEFIFHNSYSSLELSSYLSKSLLDHINTLTCWKTSCHFLTNDDLGTCLRMAVCSVYHKNDDFCQQLFYWSNIAHMKASVLRNILFIKFKMGPRWSLRCPSSYMWRSGILFTCGKHLHCHKTYGNRSYGKASKCIVIKWDTYKNKPSE